MKRLLKCPACEYTTSKDSLLRQHAISHESARLLACPHEGCDKTFKHARNLSAHTLSHSLAAFPCLEPGCPVSCSTKSNLTRHVRLVHAAPPGMPCFACEAEGCGARLRSKRSLVRHLREEHGVAPRSLACGVPGCGAAFRFASQLRKHAVTHADRPRETSVTGVSGSAAPVTDVCSAFPDPGAAPTLFLEGAHGNGDNFISGGGHGGKFCGNNKDNNCGINAMGIRNYGGSSGHNAGGMAGKHKGKKKTSRCADQSGDPSVLVSSPCHPLAAVDGMRPLAAIDGAGEAAGGGPGSAGAPNIATRVTTRTAGAAGVCSTTAAAMSTGTLLMSTSTAAAAAAALTAAAAAAALTATASATSASASASTATAIATPTMETRAAETAAAAMAAAAAAELLAPVTPAPPLAIARRAREPAVTAVGTRTRFPCQVAGCQRSFSSRSNLGMHVRAVHDRLRRFACRLPACGRVFAHRHTACLHERSQHGLCLDDHSEHLDDWLSARKTRRRREPTVKERLLH